MESPKPLRRSRRLAKKRGETVSPSPSPPNSPKNTTRRKKANTVPPNTPPVLRRSQRLLEKQAKKLQSANNTKNPIEVPPGNDIKAIANTAVVPNTAPLPVPKSDFFKDTHIFTLSGHGTAMIEDSYKLKSNEFYTTPTVCGTVRYLPTMRAFINFVTRAYKIHIPTPANASFWTGFEPRTSINNNFRFGLGTYNLNLDYEKGTRKYVKGYSEYKMYVPFVEEVGTNTIYNTSVKLFSYWSIEKLTTPPEFTFSYNDTSHTYKTSEFSHYEIYTITISGVLPSGKAISKYHNELRNNKHLTDASSRIVEIFKIPVSEISDTNLFICIPAGIPYLEIFPSKPTTDPLLAYAREAIKTVFLDSAVSLESLYGKSVTFHKLITGAFQISYLYPFIKSSLHIRDDEPMLIINNLCRTAHEPSGVSVKHTVYSNENVDPRGYMHLFLDKPRRLKLKRNVAREELEQSLYNNDDSNIPHTEKLAKLSNSERETIMKSLLKRHKITHIMYSTYPDWTEEYISFITGIEKGIWNTFLKTAPLSYFAAP